MGLNRDCTRSMGVASDIFRQLAKKIVFTGDCWKIFTFCDQGKLILDAWRSLDLCADIFL